MSIVSRLGMAVSSAFRSQDVSLQHRILPSVEPANDALNHSRWIVASSLFGLAYTACSLDLIRDENLTEVDPKRQQQITTAYYRAIAGLVLTFSLPLFAIAYGSVALGVLGGASYLGARWAVRCIRYANETQIEPGKKQRVEKLVNRATDGLFLALAVPGLVLVAFAVQNFMLQKAHSPA